MRRRGKPGSTAELREAEAAQREARERHAVVQRQWPEVRSVAQRAASALAENNFGPRLAEAMRRA